MPEGILESQKSKISALDEAKNYFNQAVNHIKTKQYLSAEPLLKRVLKIIPNHANSHQLLSMIAVEQGLFEQALKSINLAIATQAGNPDFYYNRAMIFKRQDKYKQAIADLEQLIKNVPSYHSAYIALGRIFYTLKDYKQAINYLEQSLKWVNKDESVWNDLSSAYYALLDIPQALKCIEISLQINPANAKSYASLARKSPKLEDAKQAYERALAIKPDYTELLSPLFLCKNKLCDWENYDKSLGLFKEELALTLQKGAELPISSFDALSLPLTAQQHLQIAQRESEHWEHAANRLRTKIQFKHPSHKNQRLRIGYISSSFRDYPTGHLTQDLYSSHNRERFEIYVYSYGDNDESIYRQKIEKGCDHFIDIKDYSIEQACKKIHDDKIDILVDLMGMTTGTRLEINLLRPAPINVRYLGSPTTTGSSCFDYFISDGFITPPTAAADFSEQLVLMPHTYQVNPRNQTVAKSIPTREECGLPETGIVFCAFNNSYKIEPNIFQLWMTILHAVPDSVLWLQANGSNRSNLIKAAQRYNIAGERLIFAERMSKDKHLARHKHADLFLDTPIYNAHTTASDALWMNVPVISCPGETFQSRVAGSLLTAVGLNELIMPDLTSYAAKAISLALDPKALKRLKTKLKKNCQSQPLFDTACFTSNLEKAYNQIWENYQQHKKSLIIVQE